MNPLDKLYWLGRNTRNVRNMIMPDCTDYNNPPDVTQLKSRVYVHKVRQTKYRVTDRVWMGKEWGLLYMSLWTGEWHARPIAEFLDGRFQRDGQTWD